MNLSRRWIPAATAVAVFLTGASVALADDWPQFRGVNRDGRSAETGLLESWPEDGPKLAWRIPLGEGYSGVSVVGDRLYTMYAADLDGTPTEFAAAFDAANGREIWRTPIGEKYDTEFGNGPRSTPTVDRRMVFVVGSRGDMAALDAADGRPVWTKSLTEEFGSSVPTWGFSTSVLVDGEQVVVQGGGDEGKSYAGLDRKTGKVRWTYGDGNGYNSPMQVEMNGETRYVTVVGGKLRCIDRDGKEVWSHDWPRGETHATPLFVPPNRIYASGAEGVGAQLVEVAESGGQAAVSEVWAKAHVRNHFNQAVIHGDHVYGFDNATLKAISLADGSMAWRKRGLGKGSLILAQGLLYVVSDRGKLVLLKATPDGYEEKGAVQALEGRCWTAPTLSEGRLYLRDQTQLVAYDVRG